MPDIVRITAESYDCPSGVDVQGTCALKGARPRTGRVNSGNALRTDLGGYCQRDQDDCRRHKLEFSFSEIELFHTP